LAHGAKEEKAKGQVNTWHVQEAHISFTPLLRAPPPPCTL